MSKLIGWENELRKKNIVSIQMNLLNRCTSKCKSCRKYTWPKDELDLDVAKRALKTLKEKFGLQSVVFSGGDPILYSGLSELIDFCMENDIKYSLITTLISKNAELLQKIAKTAYRIHVSVDGATTESYNYIRGVDGLTIAGNNICDMQSIRSKEGLIPIRISSTISKMNCGEIISLYTFAKKRSCTINFYLVHTWDNLKMTKEQIKEFYRSMKIIAKDEKREKVTISNAKSLLVDRYSFTSESSNCKVCYLPHVNCTIDANGDIYPCCKLLDDNGEYGQQTQYVYGNIYEEDLVGEFNKRFDRIYPSCDVCKECAQRYDGLLRGLEKIMEEVKEPIFF